MGLRTLLAIKCVSAVLGIMTGGILLLFGCQLTRHTITYSWDTAIDSLRYSGVRLGDHRINEAGEWIIDPEVERELEEGFNILVVTLAALAIGSFFSFRWAKAEIARNRGSPAAKD